MKILDQIQDEVSEYLFGNVEVSDGISFSEYNLKKRILYFKNRFFPTGKVTEQGDYEHWFDIIHPRVNHEVKNIDFDTKHVLIFSENPVGDFPAVYVSNMGLGEWMRDNGKADELNQVVEDFSADGNVLFRKTHKGYEVWDMLNTFLTNPTARTVDETAIIERFYMTQSDLRKKQDLYENVENVIENCGNKFFSRTEMGFDQPSKTPKYEIYRRTGEVSEKVLFEAQGKSGGDPSKFVLARIVVAGLRKGANSERYVLFAEELDGCMSDYFIEAHRGPYKGRWFREGMYELLFDHQVRYNDITNQIARGLEWASKVLFKHTDIQTLQNIRNALDNGALIRSESIAQIEVRLQGFDQLIADRNAVLQDADSIANSMEIVQGGNLPANTPFRLGLLQDVNAGKLYAFLRQKITNAYSEVFRVFVLKELVKDLKGKDIIRITGDQNILDGFYEMAARSWYMNNLIALNPHSVEERDMLIMEKIDEYKRTDPMIKNSKKIWEGVLPRLNVTITGENYMVEEVETISNLLQFEQDPQRRAFLLDTIYKSKGINVPPPTKVAQPAQQTQQQSQGFDVQPEPDMTPVEQMV